MEAEAPEGCARPPQSSLRGESVGVRRRPHPEVSARGAWPHPGENEAGGVAECPPRGWESRGRRATPLGERAGGVATGRPEAGGVAVPEERLRPSRDAPGVPTGGARSRLATREATSGLSRRHLGAAEESRAAANPARARRTGARARQAPAQGRGEGRGRKRGAGTSAR